MGFTQYERIRTQHQMNIGILNQSGRRFLAGIIIAIIIVGIL
jgi:hypothetical protein